MLNSTQFKGKVETKIMVRGSYRTIKPSEPPRESRELDSFLYSNNAPKCFLKGQGGWYKITRESTLLFVSRTLYLLPLIDWLSIAKDDYFIANNR